MVQLNSFTVNYSKFTKHKLFVLLTLCSSLYTYQARISLGSILVYQPFLQPFSFLILFCIHTSHIRSPHNYYLKPFVMWLNHGEALFEKLVPVYSIRTWYMGSLYVCECVFGLCALYVRVCTVYMRVTVCTSGVCPCV